MDNPPKKEKYAGMLHRKNRAGEAFLECLHPMKGTCGRRIAFQGESRKFDRRKRARTGRTRGVRGDGSFEPGSFLGKQIDEFLEYNEGLGDIENVGFASGPATVGSRLMARRNFHPPIHRRKPNDTSMRT
jgi:hypothetical protein